MKKIYQYDKTLNKTLKAKKEIQLTFTKHEEQKEDGCDVLFTDIDDKIKNVMEKV